MSRRVELGMRTRKQLADASGLTVKTLGEIERADRTSYDRGTLATVEQALRWPAGTIAAIRDGGAPPSPGERTVYATASAPLGGLTATMRLTSTDPLIAQLAEALAPDSPYRDTTRTAIRAALTRVLESAGTLERLADAAGEADAVRIVAQAAGVEHYATGPVLNILSLPGSAIDDEDREAIKDGLRALFRLATTAMMRHEERGGVEGQRLMQPSVAVD